MSLKFGKKPAVFNKHTQRRAIVMARHLDMLGPPPPVSNDYIKAVGMAVGDNWTMMGNDSVGDCVEASEGHMMMLRTANVGSIVVPSEQDILNLYSAETGYTPTDPNSDQGTDELSDCEYMQSTGLLGHMADAIGSLDPANTDHLKWAMNLFGAVQLGITVSQTMMDQFNNGQPWDADPTDTNWLGGHAVPIVHYDTSYYYVVTWGQIQKMTPEGLAQYCDEAHALVFADWVNQQGIAPNELSLTTLVQDLKNIAA